MFPPSLRRLQEILRSRDNLQAQLKALDLDFIRSQALADDRLRQINILSAQLQGAKDSLAALEQKLIDLLAAADNRRLNEVSVRVRVSAAG